MKFRYLILAMAALSVAPVLPSCTYSQMLTRQEDGMAQLNAALAGVKDKATADAAAPVVRQYGSVLRQDVSTLLSNGSPSLLQLAMLKNSYQNSNIKQESKNALGELFRIYGQGFYGSTELRQAFIDILTNTNTTTTTQTTTTPQIQGLQSLQQGIQSVLPTLLKPAS